MATADGKSVVPSDPAVAVHCPRLIDDIYAELVVNGALAFTGARLGNGGESVVEVCLARLDRPTGEDPVILAGRVAKAMAYFYRLQKSIWKSQMTCVFVVRCDRATSAAWLILQTAVLFFKRYYARTAPWRLLFVESSLSTLENSDSAPETNDSCEGCRPSVPTITVEQLLCRVDAEQMTNELGGTLSFNGADWVRFRQKLEPLLMGCRMAAKNYILLLQILKNVEQKYKGEQAWLSSTSSLLEDTSRLESSLDQLDNGPNVSELLSNGDRIIEELETQFESLVNVNSYKDSLKQVVALNNELKRVRSTLRSKIDSCTGDLRLVIQLKGCCAESEELSVWLAFVESTLKERFAITGAETMDASLLEQQFKTYCATFVNPKLDELETARKRFEEVLVNSNLAATNDSRCRVQRQFDELTSKYHYVRSLLDKIRENLKCAATCEQLLCQVCDWIVIGFQFANRLAQQVPLFAASMEAKSTAEKQLCLLNTFLVKYPAAAEKQISQIDYCTSKIECDRLKEKSLVLHGLKLRLERMLEQSRKTSAPPFISSLEAVEEDHYEKPLHRSTFRRPADNSASTVIQDYRRHSYAGGNLHKTMLQLPNGQPIAFHPSGTCTAEESMKVESEPPYDELSTAMDRIVDRVASSVSFDTVSQRLTDRSRFGKGLNGRGNVFSNFAESWFKSKLRRVTIGRSRSIQSSRHRSLENLSSCTVSEEVTTPRTPVDSRSTLVVPRFASCSKPRMESLCIDMSMTVTNTERSYVASLKYVIEHYIPEMLRADLPSQLLGQRSVIFGNIEKIYEFHVTEFLPDLLSHCTENTKRIGVAIAKRFLQHQTKFGLYALYNKNKPKSDALMSDCGSVFFQPRQLVLLDKLDLSSYLLKPVQRMGKYVLMLDQLIKGCAADDDEQINLLQEAKKMVIFQLRHGNDLLAMDSIRGCDLSLKEQGSLLRQDEFIVFKGRVGHKCIRRVFLFENLVLFAKPRKMKNNCFPVDTFDYKESIKTTDVGITQEVAEAPLKFELWIRRRTSSDVFVIQANSLEQKHAWVMEISQLLWKQAIFNRESRMAEMSSMGVLATNCFELNSVNRIEDRAVTFTRDTKLRSTLSSAGVRCERQYMERRPRSWMSVASSSSSNWSSISGSTTSYCTPDSFPQSSESGICTDLATLDECPDDSYANSWINDEDLEASCCQAKQQEMPSEVAARPETLPIVGHPPMEPAV
uniref:DH domain-containing protein n=1 Tax=Trichuris muris TaxID=70415 RepID=A0A5S6QFK6_TRIMR